MKHKFGAKRCELDGMKFPSKLEAAYYKKLKELQKQGQILFFLRQVPFHLSGNTKYVLDFMVFYAPNGEELGNIEFVELKGMDTPMSILKIKQVQAIYGIDIKVIRKV